MCKYTNISEDHVASVFILKKMKVAISSETVVSSHIATQPQKPENHYLNLHHHKNFKSYIKFTFSYIFLLH